MGLTYPINDVDRFTVYNTDSAEPLKDGRGRPMRNVPWGSSDYSQMVPGLADNIKWLLNVQEDRPDYDPATHKLLSETTYDVVAGTATNGFTVVALTQEEIDERTPAHYETPSGIKLGIGDRDQNAFANLLTLLNQSGTPNSEPIAIKDIYGVAHGMTVADFKALVVPYGQHCYSLFLS